MSFLHASLFFVFLIVLLGSLLLANCARLDKSKKDSHKVDVVLNLIVNACFCCKREIRLVFFFFFFPECFFFQRRVHLCQKLCQAVF